MTNPRTLTLAGETIETEDIPNNCPYFRYHERDNTIAADQVIGWWFDLSQMNGSTIRDEEGDSCDGPFLSLAGDWLPVIASVARCWHLDRAEEAEC